MMHAMLANSEAWIGVAAAIPPSLGLAQRRAKNVEAAVGRSAACVFSHSGKPANDMALVDFVNMDAWECSIEVVLAVVCL